MKDRQKTDNNVEPGDTAGEKELELLRGVDPCFVVDPCQPVTCETCPFERTTRDCDRVCGLNEELLLFDMHDEEPPAECPIRGNPKTIVLKEDVPNVLRRVRLLPPAEGEYEDEASMKARRNAIALMTSYRINVVVSDMLAELGDPEDGGALMFADLKAVVIGAAAELGRLDTLARANGIPFSERQALLKAGLELGRDMERPKYNWKKIAKSVADRSLSKRKKKRRGK